MKTLQDQILNDIARHLGERIIQAAADAHSVSYSAGISDERFNLRLIEIFGFLFASYAHHIWPNMSTHEMLRIIERSIKHFDENIKELRQ